MAKKQRKIKQKLDKIIGKKVKRRLAHEKFKNKSSLVFINTFGLIGWSMGVPIALCIWLGTYLDNKYPQSPYSWTFTLLIVGFVLGIINAAYWIKKETAKMAKEEELEDKIIEKESKKNKK
jgi:ATP synthase protein I